MATPPVSPLNLLVLAACASEPAQPAVCLDDTAQLWVGTSDLAVGAFAAVEIDSGRVSDRLASVKPDHVLRVREGVSFALERGQADAIRVYDDRCFAEPRLEIPLPQEANAHDIAVVGDRWYVSGYDLDHLLVLDPADGAEVGRVDLSAFADADGIPEADQMVVSGEYLYVAAQALAHTGSQWTAAGGSIVQVDPETALAIGSFEMAPNPKLFEHAADLSRLVVLTGTYFQPDGDLSVLDPRTGKATAIASEVPENAEDIAAGAFGYDLSDYAGVGDYGVAIGVGYDNGSASRIACHDFGTGEWVEGPALDSFLIDAVAGGDLVWIAARGGAVSGAPSGIFAIDPATCTGAADPWVRTSLEPYSLAFLPGVAPG